ncbi:MAG: alpha/beta fold hydrolase [Stackebrandtia sp.]
MTASRTKKSTIVRSIFIGATAATFRIGELISPALTAAAATRLWFRLPVSPKRRRRAIAPADAAQFHIDCEGTRVWGYDWGEGPLAYLVHGWGGNVGDFDVVAACLRANGWRVVAVDAPSHGNSEPGPFGPRASSPPQIAATLRAAVDKFGEPDAVVAHSMGCLAAVLALRETARPRRLVLAAPVASAPTVMETFARVLGIGPRTFARFRAAAEARVGKPTSCFRIDEPPLDVPTLVVHDRGDRQTPIRHGERIVESWPAARLHRTEGLGHMRILRQPTTVGQIAAFLRAGRPNVSDSPDRSAGLGG